MTRVLLADDHPMIRTALDVLLRDTSYELAGIAGTGEAALAELDRLEPEILLLDEGRTVVGSGKIVDWAKAHPAFQPEVGGG